ncbi:hypothetical protein SmJEL517_g04821 [Synchytrium microbalum]|uniref:3-oxoacyl-[acyl-carrier-protein] reductase n=1 Tax=Synchytrium microbalum TaxID=1806994 RepID=A0A507BX40_9FUNG|nr:uncharacterized protein SmJEL517_g04821 [Synchytrium microbalum]TPX32002.1 hypothetical protein SmJEL517_g04821 [Synchytrium microbalum]
MANKNAAARIEQVSSQLVTPNYTSATVPGKLASKVAIITGCNSNIGIGHATALEFARQGAKAIYVTDFATENLQALADKIVATYPDVKAHARRVDAAEESQVSGIVDEALAAYGRLDIFFANAGISGPKHMITDTAPADYMQTMKVNSLGPFLGVKHGSRGMKVTSPEKPESRGAIILTASVAGIRSGAGGVAYSASKASVINLAQTCAYQLTRTNIRVNALCPGLTETGMTAPTFDAARARGTDKKIGQLNPLGRYALASEMATVVAFIASDEASYFNGQPIAVDGGLSASHPVVPGRFS